MTATADPILLRMARANPVAAPAGGPVDHPQADAILSAISVAAATGGAEASAHAGRFRARRRPLALGLAGAVLAAGVAYGATALWTTDDLPPAGQGPNAFVLPSTAILPDGSASQRPPLYTDLPVRPAITFPVGVSYEEAVRSYYLTRQAGRILPDGAILTDPLPDGKVVRVGDDGRVSLDPAAPVGFDLATGLVRRFPAAPAASVPAPALPRCQVLLGSGDPASPACPAGAATVDQVQEIGGTWQAAGTATVTPTSPADGSTDIALLDRPLTAADRVPETWRDPVIFPQFQEAGADLDDARLALTRDGARYFVIPAADDSVCIVRETATETGSGCNPLGNLAIDGAMLANARTGDQVTHYGLVSDEWTHARLQSGLTIPIRNNFLAVTTDEGPVGLTLIGRNTQRELSLG